MDMRKRAALVAIFALACSLTSAPASFDAFAQAQGVRVALPAAEQRTVAAFEKRVKEYADMRERLEERLLKLSKVANPEEMYKDMTAFMEMVVTTDICAK